MCSSSNSSSSSTSNHLCASVVMFLDYCPSVCWLVGDGAQPSVLCCDHEGAEGHLPAHPSLGRSGRLGRWGEDCQRDLIGDGQSKWAVVFLGSIVGLSLNKWALLLCFSSCVDLPAACAEVYCNG